MYTKPGSGLTQQSPANEAVLHEMVCGHRQYAEARRHAELQATVISTDEKQEIQRRRAESAERNRSAAVAASRASSAKSEVQAALERRRTALELVQPDAASNDASAAVAAPPPPTAIQCNRGTLTAATQESTSAPPQATATLASEECQAIQSRRTASADKRRIKASEDTRASAAKSELLAVLERRRAASDCDAAEAQAAEDGGGGAWTPTQVSEQCTHELEDNCQVASESLQSTLHTGGAETAGMHSHLEHDAIVNFVEAPCKVSDTHSAQQPHDSSKATQAITSTRTQRAAAAAAEAAAAAQPTMTSSPFAEVPEAVEFGTACKQKQNQGQLLQQQRPHQRQQDPHQPKCCCTIC